MKPVEKPKPKTELGIHPEKLKCNNSTPRARSCPGVRVRVRMETHLAASIERIGGDQVGEARWADHLSAIDRAGGFD
jgi:hypothetical protein